MRVDDAARRRLTALLAIVGCLLGGMALSGQVARFSAPEVVQEPDKLPVDEEKLALMRATASRLRMARDEAAALGRRGEWLKAANRAGAEISEDDRNRFGLLALQAEAFYRAGKTADAAACFERILLGEDAVSIADRLALRGDLAAYARHCNEVLARPTPMPVPNSRSDPGMEANNTAWLCVVARDGLKEYSRPVELARKAVALAGSNERNAGRTDGAQERSLYLNTLGVALYRAKDDAGAIAALTESERFVSEPFNWPFLALAYHRQGNKAASQKWLTRLRKLMNDTYGTDQSQNSRHELLMFHREAETVIGGRR